MENITVERTNLLSSDKLIRIGDITFFEGPLLSLFEDFVTNDLYLYDWVDRDQKYNRWLIYKVEYKDLLQFLNGVVPHVRLINNAKSFFVSDLDNINLQKQEIHRLLELPKSYIPEDDSFFDISDCPNFDKVFSYVSRKIQDTQQENNYSQTLIVTKSFFLFSSKRKNTINYQSIYALYFDIDKFIQYDTTDNLLPLNTIESPEMYNIYGAKVVSNSKFQNSYE